MWNVNPQQQQQMLQQLMNDPRGMGQKAGYQIPDGITDPQAMVMHLIQTGQVGGPMMQRILPMIQKINGR